MASLHFLGSKAFPFSCVVYITSLCLFKSNVTFCMQTRGFLKEPDQCICFLHESSPCVNRHREAPRRWAFCSITAPANARDKFLRTRARQRWIFCCLQPKASPSVTLPLDFAVAASKVVITKPKRNSQSCLTPTAPHPRPFCSTVTKAPSPSSSCEKAQLERRRLFVPAAPPRYCARRVNKTLFSSGMQK